MAQDVQDTFMAMCGELSTPSIVDDVFVGMVADGAKGYFAGEQTLEEAVASVLGTTREYLAE